MSSLMVKPAQRVKPRPVMCALAAALLALLFIAGCADETLPKGGDPCRDITDCGGVARLSCRVDRCEEQPCERSASCPAGAACVSGFCQAPECLTNIDCAQAGGSCFEGDCRQDLCADKSECNEDQVCQGTPPTCKAPPSLCLDDADCPGQTRCQINAQRCVTVCRQDADCPSSQHCDINLCRQRCVNDQGCEPGELCIEDKCQLPPDCAQEPECPINAPLRRAQDCACVSCLSDSDCESSRGEACIENQCTYCALSGVDVQVCAGIGLPYLGGCCVGCLDDRGCAQDQRCERGRCTSEGERGCDSDAECPDGTLCDGSRCSAASTLEPCQRQADCAASQSCYPDGRCRQEATACAPGCTAPSRCVAQPGDALGACLGCQTHCQAQGCPAGQLCDRPDEAQDGRCVSEVVLRATCI